MQAIQCENLTKCYGDLTAVDRLNLAIEQGEFFSLLGLNGAGKTTAIKLLSCLSSPTGGDALVAGNSIKTTPLAVKGCIGVSPQETAVAPHLTVAENLALMGGVHGLSKEKIRENTTRLATRLGLGEILHKKAKVLSGGWCRRLSIAMALMGDPAVLFLDEPTLGLDVLARRELWQVIRELKGSITILLTTHYMEEAQALSDRIGVMHKGRLLQVGTPAQLMEKTGATSVENAFVAIVKGVQQ